MLPAASFGSQHRPRARSAACLLALLCLFSGSCGDGDALPPSDAALPPAANDSCARFGFVFTPNGCPDAACAEPLCRCPDPIGCISGRNDRCMTGVDCAVACAVDATTLFVCSFSIDPCQSDADCVTGRCVSEPGAASGECESGERGARCRNDQDCWVGNCVAGTNDSRACSPGEPSDLCNRNQDCQSGHCHLEANQLTGECT